MEVDFPSVLNLDCCIASIFIFFCVQGVRAACQDAGLLQLYWPGGHHSQGNVKNLAGETQASVVDPNTLNLDPNPGLYYQLWTIKF